ncbi:DUF222 domain-containing protein [Gordonia crocea]|uniref:HNH endonuclease n=1 Tax=Gordonia crocea TaxID=589162 RepID=A0A7I9UVI5_9ACTN|nr:DUF222 domain-containing protein [Gordonia crocea]GED96962.1 HNH endonuclease [Gordonia crocea]
MAGEEFADAGLPDSPAELARLIDAAVAKLAESPLGLTADADVLETVEAVEGAWRRAAAVNAALLVEISDRELYSHVGHTTVKRFYAQHLRLGDGEAKRRLAVAASIGVFTSMTGDKLPPKWEPLAAGVAEAQVSADHVVEVEHIMAKVPMMADPDQVTTAVEVLANAARELAPADLRPLGQRLLAHLDPDGTLGNDIDRQRRRGITIGRQDSRMMSKISGYLTPALRAKLEVLLDNWAAPGMNNPDDESSMSGSKAELDGSDREALGDAVRRDTRTPSQRNHDAIEHGLDWILGHEGLGRPDRLPAEVVITVDEADLARRAGVALTATGTLVPIPDLVALAADATPWLEVFKTSTRTVLDFRRGRRFATKTQRLAMFGADRGCTRPMCTEPFARTQAHHGQRDWADGGNTDINELAAACGTDNRNVGTRPGQWETTIIADGPDEGRVGWRLAGTDGPYRTNPVHHPQAFLRGHPQPPPEPPRRTTMLRTRPDVRPRTFVDPGSAVERALALVLAA